MFDKIRQEITDMCKEYGVELPEPFFTMLVMYVEHNITDAKQEVFDIVTDILNKTGKNV